MKVLIIRFSSIGDIVLTTPVIRCLKKQLNAEVHFLTKANFKDVLASNEYLSKLHLFEGSWEALVPKLKAEKFDLIIDLHHNLRTRILKLKIGVQSFSFDKLNIQKWLKVNLKINLLPSEHIVDRYFRTTKSLGIVNDQQGLDYFLSLEETVNLNTLPENFRQGYIGLVIGAQHFTKRLPLMKLKELCAKIKSPIILLGGPTDVDIAIQLEKLDHSRIYNACGKYSLNQSASLVQQAKAIISHDTGLMHIAAAFDKEIHSIWGNTMPIFGMSPYLVNKQFQYEVEKLKCRPCSKIGFDHCPKSHFKCMNNQNIDELVSNLSK